MCGIFSAWTLKGLANKTQQGLCSLQHRGQSAWGLAYITENECVLEKHQGCIQPQLLSSFSNFDSGYAIGHVRYPTSGTKNEMGEIQPFSNADHAIYFVHNGEVSFKSLTIDVNDSHSLFHYILEKLRKKSPLLSLTGEDVVEVLQHLPEAIEGAYSIALVIPKLGIFLTRDSEGIRPLVYAASADTFMAASESYTLEAFSTIHIVHPGSVVWFSPEKGIQTFTAPSPVRTRPCLFEYIYFAHPKSVVEEISVLQARRNMGALLARLIVAQNMYAQFDAIVPIPNSGLVYATCCAEFLNKPLLPILKLQTEARTFLYPNSDQRRQLVEYKFVVDAPLLPYQNILLIDDSLVRGTTARHVIQLLRQKGAQRIFLALAAPRVISANRFGLDIRAEDTLAARYDDSALCQLLGLDGIIFPPLPYVIDAVGQGHQHFETSMFEEA